MSKSRKAKKAAATEVEPTESTRSTPIPMLDPFDRFGLGDFGNWPAWFGRRWPERFFGDIEGIRVEQYTEGDELVIRGEIPGVDPDDIDVSIENGRLAIRAERKSKTESESDENGFRTEFRYGSFARVVTLPEGTKDAEIEASYDDGILQVRIPFDTSDAPKGKRITVKRS